MEKIILIINTGSSSKKYALYASDGSEVLNAHFESKPPDKYLVTFEYNGMVERREIKHEEYASSVNSLLHFTKEERLVEDNSIEKIGIRAVAPGVYFASDREIDNEFVVKLREATSYAPQHITTVLQEIEQVRRIFPKQTLKAISDSQAHAKMPAYARRYAIGEDDTERLGIYRFGYHGISIGSVLHTVKHLHSTLPKRIIVCHLGGGVSVTALKDGESMDTSMGFSPKSGVPMIDRAGDMDIDAALYLAQQTHRNLEQLHEHLNTESGFHALTGGIDDMRTLLEREREGDALAKLALDMFCYHIKKYIGAYTAILGGLDLIVLTATISERNPHLRSRILNGLEHLNITVDEEKNKSLIEKDGSIEKEGESASIQVLRADEMGEMYRRMK